MGERTIGEECNRCFIDEAWVSKCRLLAENAGALSAAGPARREKGRTIPGGPADPAEGRRRGEQITPNKLASRFVSVVFNTDKEIERILYITFPGHSGPNNYRSHRILPSLECLRIPAAAGGGKGFSKSLLRIIEIEREEDVKRLSSLRNERGSRNNASLVISLRRVSVLMYVNKLWENYIVRHLNVI